MGGEIGLWSEWDCKGELPWYLLQYGRHQKLHDCIKALNHFYQENPPLWERDFDPTGFEWIDSKDCHNSVISYLRKGAEKTLVIVHNFTPTYFPRYFIPLSKSVHEVFNTDQTKFGGSGKINTHVEQVQGGIHLQLAPLATMIFEVV